MRKIVDIHPGLQLKHLLVIEEVERNARNARRYRCQCDCGQTSIVYRCGLVSNPDRRCVHCYRRGRVKDNGTKLVGKKLNGWEVLKELPSLDGNRWYECRCLRCGCISLKSTGSITVSKRALCQNCKPDYHFQVENNVAEGTLPDGTTFLIDEEDAMRVSQYWWHTGKDGYVACNLKGHMIKLHRFITGETNPKVAIDHANRNTLDNRKCNLRRADTTQNAANHGLFSTNKTGYSGVYFSKASQRYESKVGWKKKRILLGTSKDDLITLAQMYIIGAIFLYGEFAGALNNVPSPDASLVEQIENKLRKYKVDSTADAAEHRCAS